MDTISTHLSLWHIALIALLIYTITTLLARRFRPGLRSIPGPWHASISDLDRVWSCATGEQMNHHLRLHAKYGRLVRIGPNHVSFADTELIPTVYSIGSKFQKSDFYSLFDIKAPDSGGQVPTIFSVRDEERHKAIKRPVANAYSLSSLKELEPMNDECSAIFLHKLGEYADGKDHRVLDLGVWLHWYAFDVISSITFSNRLGFMESETDVNNIIEAIEGRLVYNSIVGQVPWLHKYLFGNALVAWLSSFIPAFAVMNSSRYIVSFAAAQLVRYQKKDEQGSNTVELKDMLDRFKRFKDSGEATMSADELLSHATSNIFAGSDTTAASLLAIFYYLCLTPHAYEKLQSELDAADQAGQLSDPVTFAEAQKLPYFQAVIKEALRMHPAVGLLLERVVPSSGCTLDSTHHLPGGTVVGMNPWVAARDPNVYGSDAYTFRPERWLDASEEQLKVMDRNFLAFGAGARTCLGKNISLLEMGKLVPQVLRRFELELVQPEKGWKVHCFWFVRQTGLACRVKRR